MDPIIIAILVVLCQYPVAVLTLIKMFRLKWEKIPTILWNFVIVLLPFVGALAFWIYYLPNRKKLERRREEKEEELRVAAKKRAEELAAKNEEKDSETERREPQNEEDKD